MTTIYLITGFLGAGKTTFLKGRLALSEVKTGVLVNDFGKLNFDGLQMKKQGLERVELSNGSIFCSCLKDAFIDGLVYLVEQGLEEVYIESSGLADPSDMGRILSSVKLRIAQGDFRFGGTICLIDGLFLPKVLPKMLSVERQITHSHVVLINKTDLITDEQKESVRATIASLNPKAQILETTYGQLDWSKLSQDVFAIADEETTNQIATRNKNVVVHFKASPYRFELQRFLESLGEHFFRVKGIVRIEEQDFKVDLVNTQIAIEPADTARMSSRDDEAGQLVCLTSQGLDSISHIARMIEQHLPGLCSLEM